MRKSTRSFLVREDQAGSRLDRYLTEALGASRSEVRKLLARGAVAVDDRVVGSSAKGAPVLAGSRIEVASFRPPASQHPVPDPESPLVTLAEGRILGGALGFDDSKRLAVMKEGVIGESMAGIRIFSFLPADRST